MPEAKSIENRLYLDFRPDRGDVEVGRLLALGAARVDVARAVLADIDGNGFRGRAIGSSPLGYGLN